MLGLALSTGADPHLCSSLADKHSLPTFRIQRMHWAFGIGVLLHWQRDPICQGALLGGFGGWRYSGEELRERFLDMEETSKPIKLNPICHFIVEKTDGKLLACLRSH